jgi:recombination protein RecA
MAINTDTSGKQKALTMVLNQIERSFGKGAIMRLGDATRMRVEFSIGWWFTQGAGN